MDAVPANHSADTSKVELPAKKKSKHLIDEDSKWEEMIPLLLEYKNEHGDTLVPRSRKVKGRHLGNWVKKQRSFYEQGSLLQSRVLRLNSIEFNWKGPIVDKNEMHYDNIWKGMFKLLLEYQRQHGDTLVPPKNEWKIKNGAKGFKKKNAPDGYLGNWVRRQRNLYRKEMLGQFRIFRLNSTGFVWILSDHVWEEMFQLLLQYKKEHGNTLVPYKFRGIDGKLEDWVNNQRQFYRNKWLPQSLILRLNSIGFVWKRPDDRLGRWNEMFFLLQEYKQEHGDTLVCSYKASTENRRLATWVRLQRWLMSQNRLVKDRINQLQSIGFVFDDSWQRKGSKKK